MKVCRRCPAPAKGGRGLCKPCYDQARANGVLDQFPVTGQNRVRDPAILAWLKEHVPDFEGLAPAERRCAVQRAKYHVDAEYRERHQKSTYAAHRKRAERERIEVEQSLDQILEDYLAGLAEVPEQPAPQRDPCVRCARRVAPWGEQVCTDCLVREMRAKPEEVAEWLSL